MGSKAFTKLIEQNSPDSHQTSPGAVLTFLRWKNRDPLRFPSINPRQTRRPLVVENDCVKCVVTENKAGVNGSVQLVLLSGDINYRTAISTGDFVFVNMLNWTESTDNDFITVKQIAKRARALKPINRVSDGFKGFFKVQSVRKGLVTDADGKKHLSYFIQAYSFTEFNVKMYFNPFLVTSGDKNNDLLFATRISDQWNNLVGTKSQPNIQEILKIFITSFLGEGISSEGKKFKGVVKSPNDLFFMPSEVGKLLGQTGVKKAVDVYNFLMGIQQYNATSGRAGIAKGFNPSQSKVEGRFIQSSKPIDGKSIIKPEYWNQKQVWSILKQYLNDVLNEMYTTHRVDSAGRVMPTVVIRQKPFTTEHFGKSNFSKSFVGPLPSGANPPVTRFFNLPRWKIDPKMVLDNLNLGVDEAARINFVQVFGRSILPNAQQNIAEQIAKTNYVFDKEDILRHGLKPWIATSNFDFPGDSDPKGTKSPGWTSILADQLIGGHLKDNGTIPCAGIEDPIAVGDNLEFDGVVYHIESFTHTYINTPDGYKSFRTSINVANGVDLRSNAQAPFYPEMQFTDALTQKEEDFIHSKILPGFSDTQNIPGRDRGEEINETKELSFDPFNRSRPKGDD